MNSVKGEIFEALTEDAELMKIFDKDKTKITDEFPTKNLFSDTKSNFPRLTYALTERRPVFFTDNLPSKDEVTMSFNIWLLPDNLMAITLAEVSKELTRVLRTIGYIKIGSDESFDVDQKVFYTSLSFTKKNVDSNL